MTPAGSRASRILRVAFGCICAAVAVDVVTSAEARQAQTTRQASPPNISAGGQTNWTSHNLDLHNRRYSELNEINTGTVSRLRERWSFVVPAGTDVAQVTPLVVDGVMYFHAGAHVFAVNAVTGESVWTLELDSAARNRVRGPTYANGKIYAYNGANLVAADAETGELVESFGDGGVLPVVGLALQTKYPDIYPPTLDPTTIGYRITSAPAYHDNTLYLGAALSEGHIPGGLLIATDATTGAIKWVFKHDPQRPQDDGWRVARDTWGAGARAGGGIWTQPAIDLDLGLIYINSGNPVARLRRLGAPRHQFIQQRHDRARPGRPGARVGTTRRCTTTCGIGTTSPGRCSSTSRETPDGQGGRSGWQELPALSLGPGNRRADQRDGRDPRADRDQRAGEQVWPTQPMPHNARGVPMTPFCATFIDLDDPELRAQARQMYTPYSTNEHYIVAHGGSSFGSTRLQPAHAAALRHRQERRRLADRQSGRRHTGARPGRSRPHGELRGAQPHPRLHPTTTLTAYEPVSGDDVWQQVLPAATPIGASAIWRRQATSSSRGPTWSVLRVRRRDRRAAVHARGAASHPVLSPLTYEVNGTQYVAVIATNTVLAFALP